MTSRREFLMRLAGVSGVAGLYVAAQGLGLLEGSEAWAGPPALPNGAGAGARVVILGAGVGGLSAAIELSRAGYACTVLEARDRAGGRSWTLRKGSVLEMTDGTRQVCQFDDGHYFNAGPARIPSHHQATLGYARELKVPMETLVNYSGSTKVQADGLNGGKPVQVRQALYDSRGHVSELLAKAVRNGGLNAELSKADGDRLIEHLRQWGPLNPDLAYGGTDSAGYVVEPGAGAQVGVHRPPLPRELAFNPLLGLGAGWQDIIDMQATMQQPVGGMDQIALAMEAALAPGVVRKGAEVTRIARRGAGVAISYTDKASGRPAVVEADYCICTIPLKVLNGVANDFAPDRKAAIAKAVYDDSIKVAFQSPRFWETDDQIYGGLSFTDRDTFMTWYPSNGFHTPQGVLVAGYAFDQQARNFAALPLAQQFAYARATVDRLHPGRSGLLKAPIAIAWQKVPYNLGITCPLDLQDAAAYTLLSEADGPFYFAGEHLSHVGAWQQGAIVSGHRSAVLIDARHRRGQPVTASRPQ